MQGIKRADIKPGLLVRVVTKEDQRTGRLTEGIVKDVLTKSPTHPHGIKVRLESGTVIYIPWHFLYFFPLPQ